MLRVTLVYPAGFIYLFTSTVPCTLSRPTATSSGWHSTSSSGRNLHGTDVVGSATLLQEPKATSIRSNHYHFHVLPHPFDLRPENVQRLHSDLVPVPCPKSLHRQLVDTGQYLPQFGCLRKIDVLLFPPAIFLLFLTNLGGCEDNWGTGDLRCDSVASWSTILDYIPVSVPERKFRS